MVRGFYRMTFTGTAGSGFGVIAFHDGAIAGADVAGTIFDGSYSENLQIGGIDFQVIMKAPAGVMPVQTGIPLAAPISVEINGSILLSDVDSDRPTRLETQLGPVNALFQKIRDF
jgi:hypothetical protein